MRARLRGLAAGQGGLFTRQQAIDCGYTMHEIRRLTREGGAWALVRRGVYAERAIVEAAETWERRMLLRDMAAHLHMRRPHLMSHDSAARILDLPMLRPAQKLVHVTRFGVGGSRITDGVKHHLTQVGLLGTQQSATMRVTGLARTALDIGREHGYLPGLVACDATRQRGVDLADLEAELSLMWCWPQVASARAAVAGCDPGAESIGETLLRDVVDELGIGQVETQFPVLAAGRVNFCDMRVGRHLFEFDGDVKFVRIEAGGIADRDATEIVLEEKRRQDAICAQQLGMSRVAWGEVFGRGRETLKRRLLSEYAATAALFGDQLSPEMRAFADRHRPGRLAGGWRRTA